MNNAATRYWLLMALAVAFAPHLQRVPWWLALVLILALVWRLPLVEQRIALPNTVAKVLLLLAGVSAIRYSFNTLFGPEAGTAFLLFCVGLKVLEAQNERDHYILLTLSFFVLATMFLFQQGLLPTIYVSLAIVIITSAYVAFNMKHGIRQIIGKALALLLQAAPLMIILFIFFPRLPPLWTLKLTEGSGRTGMSDSMAPGDLASLSQSNELAFRVEFEHNKLPAKSELYWRGLTLSRFDGITWRPSASPWLAEGMAAWSNKPLPSWVESQIMIGKKPPLKYKVMLEPTDKTWLYSLSVAYSHTRNVGLTRDFRLVSQFPVFQVFEYDVLKFEPLALDQNLPDWLRQDNLQLPSTGNNTARQMARQWRAHYRSDEQYVLAILRWFRTSQFFYTLEPPALGDNRIDEFLFSTKRGFCEHYASAFTFLMRAAGIPARVVVGYQGGTPSPTGDSWQVRQMDAHAWSEIWLEGKGWVRMDPTGAVAPERIQRGMSEVASSPAVWGDSALSIMKYGNYKLLGRVRNMVDYLNYRWQKDIIGYNANRQDDFLLRLLGDANTWKRLAVMFGALIVIVALLAAWTILRARKIIDPADKAILRLSASLQKRGLQRQPGEGVLAWLARLQQAQPHWQPSLHSLGQHYSRLRYQGTATTSSSHELRQMARLVRNLPEYRAQSIKEQ